MRTEKLPVENLPTGNSTVDDQSRPILLAGATEFARQGHYDDACRILGKLGGRAATDSAVLDLLARIHAQRGELADADACWALAESADAELPGPRAGRRRIAAIQARRYHLPATRAAGAIVLAAALVAAGVSAAALTGDDASTRDELHRILDSQVDLSRQVTDLRGNADPAGSHRDRVLHDLDAALANSPLIVASDRDARTVTFPAGLFTGETALSPEGRQAIADLAGRLRPYAANLEITVIGHTDARPLTPTSGYTDNVDLGLARARVAATELSGDLGLPPSGLAITSTGSADPPFPGSGTDSRDRTATVRIRPV